MIDGPVLDVDVIVLGGGPVGLTLARLLAKKHVRVAVVERRQQVLLYTRAANLYGDVMRVLQAAGIAKDMESEISVLPVVDFTIYDNDWKPLLVMGNDGTRNDVRNEQGWYPHVGFWQPNLESRLRGRLADDTSATLLIGWDATQIDESDARVTVTMERGNERQQVVGKYLVGCDGANSLVRRYLDPEVEDLNGTQRSLIIDVFPFDRNHPLVDTRPFIHCRDHDNPITLVRLVPPRRRFEVMLRRNEETTRFLDADFQYDLLRPWLKPGDYRIERADIYQWESLLVKGWRRRRCLLAGDAAHTMSPMLGQGMGSGMRDAANLAWKLGLVVRGEAAESVLDTYESERAPNVRKYIVGSANVANLVESWIDNPPSVPAGGRPQNPELERLPWLGPGLHGELEDGAGTLSVQPTLNDGRLMDDVVDYNFAVLGGENALQSVDETTRKIWKQRGIVEVADDGDLTREWLARHSATAALIRPDGFVFAMTGPGELDAASARLDTALRGS